MVGSFCRVINEDNIENVMKGESQSMLLDSGLSPSPQVNEVFKPKLILLKPMKGLMQFHRSIKCFLNIGCVSSTAKIILKKLTTSYIMKLPERICVASKK